MLHHVGIEVGPGDVDGATRFFELLDFERVEPPPALAEFTWLQSEGTQVHLMPTESPTVPPRGHLAVLAPDFEATIERLRAGGFEVERRREHWGAPRAVAICPGGHRVELTENPPRGRALLPMR